MQHDNMGQGAEDIESGQVQIQVAVAAGSKLFDPARDPAAQIPEFGFLFAFRHLFALFHQIYI